MRRAAINAQRDPPMPKASLTYSLPEEKHEHLSAVHGSEYQSALWEIDQWLRNLVKYEDRTVVQIEDVRKRIRDETEGLPFDI